ncbi:MAG TPA: hypothetical protein VKO83_12500 [Steroidobacteraceae bacterium]|nr:hypothetical protein [Steroidobacteraceae bacterium]
MLPRRLLPWLFALTLLLGQAAAFAHTLGHLHAHDPGLPDKVCEVCVAQAQLGSALPPSLVSLTLPAADCIVATGVTPFWVDLAPCPACARAPPASSDA